jgi:DNA polymerase elongation subunit (family B)
LIVANDRYLFKKVYSVYKFEFVSIYPSIIIKQWKNGMLQFNHELMGYIFYTVFNKRGDIKKIDTHIYLIAKVWINYFFGIVHSNKNNISSNIPISLVTEISREILSTFYEKFSKNTLYCDTDSIYAFPESLEMLSDMVKYLDDTDYDYDTNNVDWLLVMAKKRYMEFSDGVLRMKGIQEINGK